MAKGKKNNAGRNALILGGAGVLGLILWKFGRKADAAGKLMMTVMSLSNFGFAGMEIRFMLNVRFANPSQQSIDTKYIFLNVDFAGLRAEVRDTTVRTIAPGSSGMFALPVSLPIFSNVFSVGMTVLQAVKSGDIAAVVKEATVKGYVETSGVRVEIDQRIPIYQKHDPQI